MVSTKSGIHPRAPGDPSIELGVVALTRCARTEALVTAVAPEACGVAALGDRTSLELELGAHPVLTAVVLDMDLPELDRRRLVRLVTRRWPGVPVIALLRSSSAGALAAAVDLADVHLHRTRPDVDDQLRIQLRRALDRRLEWIARRLRFAEREGLRKAALATFVAHTVCQVRRDELRAYFGIGKDAVEKRVRKLCAALEMRCLADVGLSAGAIPETPVPRSWTLRIEQRALEARGDADTEIRTSFPQ